MYTTETTNNSQTKIQSNLNHGTKISLAKPIDKRATENAHFAKSLGELSAKYESGNSDPAIISSGIGDFGGVSYGIYQFSSKPNGGTVALFIAQEDFKWKKQFANLQPGSPEFNAVWKRIGTRSAVKFGEAQHNYIRQTHFDPMVANIFKATNCNILEMSIPLQQVIWSTAVQHGRNSKIPIVAWSILSTQQQWDSSLKRDWAWIENIYRERSSCDNEGNLAHFINSSPEVQASVKKRFVSEKTTAQKMLQANSTQPLTNA